jgi:hypothetical protein
MTDLRPLALELLLASCAIGVVGCAVATVVDVGKTVVKIPFMLGKGVYDALREGSPSQREPAVAPVVESPALGPAPVVESPAWAQEPVAIPYPVSPGELPGERN